MDDFIETMLYIIAILGIVAVIAVGFIGMTHAIKLEEEKIEIEKYKILYEIEKGDVSENSIR